MFSDLLIVPLNYLPVPQNYFKQKFQMKTLMVYDKTYKNKVVVLICNIVNDSDYSPCQVINQSTG